MVAAANRMHELTDALGGRIAFGCDYNPEQWPEEIWVQDVALMREAGVNLVSVGIFSWGLLEPSEGRYDFGWLDRVLDVLHEGGVKVDLATATASPPAWFSHQYPHTLLVDADGVRRSFGARQSYCPSAPEFRAATARLARRLGERYADHPGVVMWHLNNEYGCQNWHCYCDVSAGAFRDWLRARYATLHALNCAWGTAFWSQHYSDWAQIGPPRRVSYNSFANPGQQLDWWRFSNDELRNCYRAEAAALRPVVSQPLTTNFMGFFKPVDYRSWTDDIDVISNDHYLIAADPRNTQQLAMTADLLRSLADQRPWLLMEHSTSAVNWQPRNVAKAPGQLRRNSMQHIARGADGALFFQWRASRAGAEKFHSGLVPHAGTDTKVWRDVIALGADLASIAEVAGSTVEPASVAIVFDWPSWWAAELDAHPSVDVAPLTELRHWHELCWQANVGVDIVGSTADLDRYQLVILPVQYLLDDDAVQNLTDCVTRGATLVATYFTGIVDERDHVRLGGYPGALRDLLGVQIEEFFPLLEGGSVALSAFGAGTVWSELGRVVDAEVLATYLDGPTAGSPAITRNGRAWYVGTSLGDAGREQLGELLFAAAGVSPTVSGLPRGVEATRRRSEQASYLFLVNHTGDSVEVAVAGTDLLTAANGSSFVVAAGGVAVVREA